MDGNGLGVRNADQAAVRNGSRLSALGLLPGVLWLTPFSRLDAQYPDSTLVNTIRRLDLGDQVRAASMGTVWTGELQRSRGDTLVLNARDQRLVPMHLIDSLWVGTVDNRAGVVGFVVGAVVGGAVGWGLVSLGGSIGGTPASTRDKVTGAGIGGVIVGFLTGSLTGVLASDRVWKRLYPSPRRED